MMADLKEDGSIALVVTMAVSEILERRKEVMERRLSFQKEKSLSRQCSGKMDEQRTLKEVDQKLSTLVDETLGGERSKANLRQLGTSLLKLKIWTEKQIMSLMMQPEENERGVCQIVEEFSKDLAKKRVCSNEQVNEVGFKGSAAAGDDECFSNIAFSYNLIQFLEKTESESKQILTNNMGGFNQKDQIIEQLERLEAIHQRLEQLQKIQGLLSLQVHSTMAHFLKKSFP